MPKQEMPPDEPVHHYCDGAKVIINNEIFLIALQSGGEQGVYMFTPEHAKRLMLALIEQVKKFETAYRPIAASLAPSPMLSPMQKEDLDGKKG